MAGCFNPFVRSLQELEFMLISCRSRVLNHAERTLICINQSGCLSNTHSSNYTHVVAAVSFCLHVFVSVCLCLCVCI